MGAMRKAPFAMLAALCLGCLGGGIVGSSTVNGVYTLRSINGSPLPYTISTTATGKTEVLDDAITLYEGFTFSESIHTRITVNGQATEQTNTTTGGFSLLGNSITLSINGQLRVGTIDADVMTFVNAGLTSVFKK
jgi:hypothetical protein